jgi:hypothetical protein
LISRSGIPWLLPVSLVRPRAVGGSVARGASSRRSRITV